MIAKNYIKYPEALRFQCEMFSNGYHNSPRIMRLMEVIFDWSATVPAWVTEAKARARNLVKAWKSRMVEMFEMIAKKPYRYYPIQMELVLFPEPETKKYWSDTAPTRPQKTTEKTPKDFRPFLLPTMENKLCLGGKYASYCRNHQKWAMPTKSQDSRPYWGGLSD
jgi:hypothetical protein